MDQSYAPRVPAAKIPERFFAKSGVCSSAASYNYDVPLRKQLLYAQ
jgi:hypothetical protein